MSFHDEPNPNGAVKVSAYGNNGPMTEVMHYKINGQTIYGTIDINLNSPTYGQEIKVEAKQNGPFSKRTEVPPNSELGQAIAADVNSTRQTAYINEMSYIGGKAEKAGFGTVHDLALEESGMKSFANGDKPYESELPAVYFETEEIKKEENDGDGNIEPAVVQKDRTNMMKNETLRYPIDAQYTEANGQDHIFIEQFAFVAPQRGFSGQSAKENSEKGALRETVTGGLRRGSNIVDPDTRKTDPKGRVLLPMPNKLLASNGVSWGEGRANAVEAGAFFAANNAIGGLLTGGKNIGDVLKDATTGGLGLLGDVRGELKKNPQSETGAILSATLSKLALSKAGINVDPAQFITRSTGKAINPNLELLFNGPKLRTFTFGFQFAPNDADEAIVVRKIQRFFKQGMLPQRTDGGGKNSAIFLGSPNVFRIRYRSGRQRIRSLNMFKVCALTAIEFDYAPDNVYQAYDDASALSQPVRTSMALSFTELTPILEQDYSDLDKSESIRDLSATALPGPTVFEDDQGNVPNMTEDDVGF